MKIRIYQINSDRDENRMMFLSHDRLERFQGSPEVDSKIYDKVYDKEVDCSNLEEVYTLLNIDHPEDYRGRSLSVSDVVEVMKAMQYRRDSTSAIALASNRLLSTRRSVVSVSA